MATRRKTSIDVPLPSPPSQINGNTKPSSDTTTSKLLDTPSSTPWLPTILELSLLSIYPITLTLGSLSSTIGIKHPYNPILQSYESTNAPSYFAKKSNVFNVYFVKVGWFWITLAFALFVLTHRSFNGGNKDGWLTRRRIQAGIRYAAVTLVWIFVTQWFFGPPVIDRGFVLTGGKCALVLADPAEAKEELGEVKGALTHAACKAAKGQWRGGHDISGHVFLLMLGSAMLGLEILPVILNFPGLREARKILTPDGLVRSSSVEADAGSMHVPRKVPTSVRAALVIAGGALWMLLMTAAYFHTWFEKFTGFLVAGSTLYAVYFLPRAIPALRQVVGMPAV